MAVSGSVSGIPQLRARLKAVRLAWKPVARDWAELTAEKMQHDIPVRTGKTRKSVRVGNVTQRRATVKGSYVIDFLSSGTKAHAEVPKRKTTLAWKDAGGQTIFARKVNQPQHRGTHIREKAATEAFEKTDILGSVVKLWNDAA